MHIYLDTRKKTIHIFITIIYIHMYIILLKMGVNHDHIPDRADETRAIPYIAITTH